MNHAVKRCNWQHLAIGAGVIVVAIVSLLALATPVTAVAGVQDTSGSPTTIVSASENENSVSEYTLSEGPSNSGDVHPNSGGVPDVDSPVNDTAVDDTNTDGVHNVTNASDRESVSTSETVTVSDDVLEEERLKKFVQWQDISLISGDNEYASMDDEGFNELGFSDPYFNMQVDNAQDVDLSGDFDDAWLRFEAYHGTRSSGNLYPVFGPSYSDVQGLDNVYWSEPLERDDASTSWDHHAVRLDTGPSTTFTEYLSDSGSGELHFYQTADEGATTSGWRVRDASIGVPIVDNPETKTSSDVSVSIPEDTEYIKDVWVTFDYERHSESRGLHMEVGDSLWVTPTDLDGDSGTHERWISPTAFDSEDTSQITFSADSGTGSVQGGDYTISNVEVEWVLEVQDFEVEITDMNSPVKPGDNLEVTVDITNPGPADSTQNIALNAGSLGSDSASIQLDGHESTTETFTVSTSSFDSGSYSVTVSSDGNSDSKSVEVLEPADFDASITHTNSPVEAGETVEVTVDIENQGDVSERQTIELDISGLGSDSESVYVEGGSSTTVDLSVPTTAGDADSYTATVSSADDSDSKSVTINEQPDEAEFEVTLGATNSPIEEDNRLTINANIENIGDLSGTKTVDLEVPGLGSDSQSVTLDGGEELDVGFDIHTTVGDAGSYTATVESPDDSESTSVSVEEQPDPADFEVSITDSTSPVEAGERIELTVSVTNTGDLSATKSVGVSVTGLGSDSKSVQLSGGDSTETTLFVDTASGDAGEYTTTVDTPDSEDSTSVIVTEQPDDAEFVITDLDTDSSVEAGEIFEAIVTVENSGDIEADSDITFDIPSIGTTSESLTLDGGTSDTVKLAIETATGDAGNYMATAETSHDTATTSVTIAQQPQEAFFEVEILDTTEPTAGNPLEVTAAVTNTGDLDGTSDIDLNVPTLGEDTAHVELAGGESTHVDLSVDTTSDNAGEYDMTVKSFDDTAETTLTIDPPTGDANFNIEIVETKDPVTVGEPYEVTVEIENSGETDGRTPVVVSLGNISESSTNVDVAAGDTTTEQLSVPTTNIDPDTYTTTIETPDDLVETNTTITEVSNGAVDAVEHPPTVVPNGSFTVDIVTNASAGTVAEFDTAGFDVELTSDDAVEINETRVEFLDPAAGNSTYTIDVDVTGGESGDNGTLSVWVNAEEQSKADDSSISTFEVSDTHPSGVSQPVWGTVTDQSDPTDELTFQDLVDGIQAYQDDGSIDGTEIAFQDLVDLIEWYQR